MAARDFGLHRPLILIKEPNGSHAAPILRLDAPRSRLLCLLRDGRDVLDSLVDAVSPGGWLAGGLDTEAVGSARGRIAFLRESASLWVHRIGMVQRAMAAHPPELAMAARYERLRADTTGGMREMDAWLGHDRGSAAVEETVAATSFEGYPANAKGRGKAVRLATPGHWRESMSAEEQDAVQEVMGDTLSGLGYQV